MKKQKNNLSIKSYIKKLNEIDINILISNIRKINIEDLQKIDINKLIIKIKESSLFKPSVGIFSASFLLIFLLIPKLDKLINTFNLANQYKKEESNIPMSKLKFRKIEEKIQESSALMSELNEAIIRKEDILFISKLINETAIKSNVEIISILPIDSTSSAKLCNLSNRKTSSRRRKQTTNKKGSFQENFYEINLKSNYLDVIKFLNQIQYYDVLIIPNCLKVSLDKNQKNTKPSEDTNITKIIPLSESGLPISSYKTDSNSFKDGYSNRVISRLVLKIPSHSK